MTEIFTGNFTQQTPIPEAAQQAALRVMQSGRLHRYNLVGAEPGEVGLLEQEYAAWQGARYCLAVASGGAAMALALRAAGVQPGEAVLTNAFTLAPVPGAVAAVGARPVYVEVTGDLVIDLDDLSAKIGQARVLLLSHMRGHLGDMDRLMQICDAAGVTVIEDCAHTMGARWNSVRSGQHGRVACFSTQTYKHMNSGEGGFLTTDDPEIAARAVIGSGSYMLYGRHGAAPKEEVFRRVRLHAPNCSARMDNLRAALLRAQLPLLEDNVRRWNERYRILADGIGAIPGVFVPPRAQHEAYVGSSFQFHARELGPAKIPDFIRRGAARGVEIKWFGADEPLGFTSRFDSWRYLGQPPELPRTRAALSTTCDLRVPLTFEPADCEAIVRIVAEAFDESR